MKIQLFFLAFAATLTAIQPSAADHARWGDSIAAMFVRKYDANEDGKLNADEYPERYRKQFGTTDVNQDGYVDSQELKTKMAKLQPQWRERMQQQAQEHRNRKLQQLVDRTFAADANGDERLNADEASDVIKKSFGQVDSDNDGYLIRAEVEAAYGLKPQALKTIVETAAAAGSFETLIRAATAAGLADALQGEGPFTVLAPTDAAFAKIPAETLTALLGDKDRLAAVLKYHVIPGKVLAKDVVALNSAKTLQGQSVEISVTDEGVQIDNANVLKTDIACSNGVIHVIDSVLLPEFVESASDTEPVLLRIGNGNVKKQWGTVNDGVMGGVSEGNVRFTDDETLEFYGNLSLRNNGGFASARSTPRDLGFEDGDTLVARVRGDGREYYLNLYEPTYRMAFSYRAPIKTEEGQWIELRVPLSDFYATSFGRRVRGSTLSPSKINSVGFLLADKKEGPFRLEVESIRVARSTR